MGVITWLEKEKVWALSYRNGANCPFIKDLTINAGTLNCINCPSFISVDRDRGKYTTLLKCRGKPPRGTFRTFLEKH